MPSRLTARTGVAPPAEEPLGAGLHRLRSAWLCVPAGVAPERPVPLLVVLHGAGSTGRAMLELLGEVVGVAGALVLAPDSAGRTWDVIQGGFGPDVATIDAALAETYARWDVDPQATVLAGFSDGASYALSLGLDNGDCFSHLVAFSPGFMAPSAPRRPRPPPPRPAPRPPAPPVFFSQGRADPVLPIDRCSRRIAPALRAAG